MDSRLALRARYRTEVNNSDAHLIDSSNFRGDDGGNEGVFSDTGGFHGAVG